MFCFSFQIYNWEPKPYTDKPDELVLPEGVAYNQNQVWIHCIGEVGFELFFSVFLCVYHLHCLADLQSILIKLALTKFSTPKL